jgi:hypothetical protein
MVKGQGQEGVFSRLHKGGWVDSKERKQKKRPLSGPNGVRHVLV